MAAARIGLEQRLSAAYPAASPARVAVTAYALACLFEAHWAFHLQGVNEPDRTEQAKQSAHTLLSALAAA